MRILRCLVRLLALISIQAMLFGCGSSNDTVAPNVGKTRKLLVGDSWTYDVSGQSQSGSFSGTSILNITQDTLAGVSVLAATSTVSGVLNGSNTSSTSVTYMQQDATTGDLLLYGLKDTNTNNVAVTVTDRPLPIMWPGNWEAGKTINATAHYSNGTTESISYSIIGQESVATPTGAVTAWKLIISVSSNAIMSTGTFWFSPEIGNYIKMDVTNSAGSSSTILRSTTVK
ncbi:DUF3108 domain-containing protein [Geotalea uraniireducens]|uniref:DUF3108 domain-containing protein n=1 Tax=Geotalea uraniireducens TaxID=351604 RepID=UPI00006B5AE6|nr:hypothetical protein [Geotalea uraniireducens]